MSAENDLTEAAGALAGLARRRQLRPSRHPTDTDDPPPWQRTEDEPA